MTDSNTQIIQTQVTEGMSRDNRKTHRQPTASEWKEHEKNKPVLLAAIRKAHGQTMRKVAKMNGRVMWNDKK